MISTSVRNRRTGRNADNDVVMMSHGRIGLIITSQKYGNRVAVVDAADYPLVGMYRWSLDRNRNTFYAKANIRRREDGSLTKERLHRLLIPEVVNVDHIDRNGLNNARSNLRPVIRAENGRNRRRQVNNKSGYCGVHWDKRRCQWRAQIRVNGKQRYLGIFDDPADAARAFDAAALEAGYLPRGLNFPNELPSEAKEAA